MNQYEIIGIIASLFILLSMSIKSNDTMSNIRMRILNLVGSLIFIIYGLMLPAYSTAILNSIVSIVNIYYIVRLYGARNK